MIIYVIINSIFLTSWYKVLMDPNNSGIDYSNMPSLVSFSNSDDSDDSTNSEDLDLILENQHREINDMHGQQLQQLQRILNDGGGEEPIENIGAREYADDVRIQIDRMVDIIIRHMYIPPENLGENSPS